MYRVFKLRLIIVVFLSRSVYNTLVNLLNRHNILIISKSKPTYLKISWLTKNISEWLIKDDDKKSFYCKCCSSGNNYKYCYYEIPLSFQLFFLHLPNTKKNTLC